MNTPNQLPATLKRMINVAKRNRVAYALGGLVYVSGLECVHMHLHVGVHVCVHLTNSINQTYRAHVSHFLCLDHVDMP